MLVAEIFRRSGKRGRGVCMAPIPNSQLQIRIEVTKIKVKKKRIKNGVRKLRDDNNGINGIIIRYRRRNTRK